MSKKLATACAGITAVLWLIALRYGNFSRKAQRTYQDALAETNQASCGQALSQVSWDGFSDCVTDHPVLNSYQPGYAYLQPLSASCITAEDSLHCIKL